MPINNNYYWVLVINTICFSFTMINNNMFYAITLNLFVLLKACLIVLKVLWYQGKSPLPGTKKLATCVNF